MKKLLFILTILLIAPFCVHAEEYITTYRVNDTDGLRVRISATTNSSQLGSTLLYGTTLNVLEKVTSTDASDKCDNKVWYKVSVSAGTGYVCAYYVSENKVQIITNTNYNYNEELAKFPVSYRASIENLHKLHPNWEFYAKDTGLSWDKMMTMEKGKGYSLIWYSYGEGYRSKEPYSYNYATDTYSKHDTELNWWYASDEAIAYYMDPRFYLNEKYIFGFESLSYVEGLHTATLVDKILGKSFMPTLYAKYFTTPYTDSFLKAGKDYNVSPVHLASRILQEQGYNGSRASSGETFTYNGVTYSSIFNFYNIKACGQDPTTQGVIWASGGYDGTGTSYGRPWNTPSKSILGGAQFLSEDYITPGQNTLYSQKFDILHAPANWLYQYQQNIMAPSTEGNTSMAGYSKIDGIIDQPFAFFIPIYSNMPEQQSPQPVNKNPNDYLKDLKIDNTTVTGFVYNNLNYTYNVDNKVTSINILATPINSKATITGTGVQKLNVGLNNITIKVVAENGATNEYKLAVTRLENKEKLTVNEILDASGVKYNDTFIHGINPNTSISSLQASIKESNPLASIVVKNKSGNIITEGNFKTGDVVTVIGTQDQKDYSVIIYGDINGDGIIDKLDALAILRDYYNYSKLAGIYSTASDINHDGVVDKLDALAVLRDYYGYAKITQ